MPLRIAKASEEKSDATVDRLREALTCCGKVDFCTDCPMYRGEKCEFAGTYLAWLDRTVTVIGQLAREYESMMTDKIDRMSFDPGRDKMRLQSYLHAIRSEFGIK